jgi:uncharacterized protein YjdB
MKSRTTRSPARALGVRMPSRHRAALVPAAFLLSLLSALTACESGSTLPGGIDGIQLDQTRVALDEGGTARLRVLSRDASGVPREVPPSQVTWTVADASILAVTDGVLTALRAGETRVTASVSARYSASADVQVIAVPGGFEIIGGNNQSGIVGAGLPTPVRLRLMDRHGRPLSGARVEFRVEDGTGAVASPATAIVGPDGIVETSWTLGRRAGPQRLEAGVKGRTDVLATVFASGRPGPLSAVEILPSGLVTNVGYTTQFGAVARDAFGNAIEGVDFTWATLDPAIASVDAAGLLTAVAHGDTELEATAAQGGAASADGSQRAPWNRATIRVGNFSPPGQVVDLAITGTTAGAVTLSFTEVGDGTGQPARYQFRYSTRPINPNFASNPVVTNGTCANLAPTSIGAKRTCIANGLLPSTAYDFQVIAYRNTISIHGLPSNVATGTTKAQQSNPTLTLSPTSVSMIAGGTAQLGAVLRDGSGNIVQGASYQWSSSNASIASVSAGGLVSAGQVGSATITVAAGGLTATATVSVAAGSPATVTITPSSATLSAGSTTQLAAQVRDAGNNLLTNAAVSWSSSNAGIATVAGNGTVTGVAAGSATITATSGSASGTATVTVQAVVQAQPSSLVILSGNNQSGTAGSTLSNPLTVRVRDQSGNNLPGVTVTWSVTSGGGSLSQTTSTTDNLGRAQVGYTLGTTAGSNGVRASVGSLSPVDFTATGTAGAAATVDVTPASAGVNVGGTQQYQAQARDQYGNAVTGLSYTWSSSNTGIATINGSGLATGVAAGSTTVRVTAGSVSGTAGITVAATSGGGTSNPGRVTNLTVTTTSSGSATLSFTEVDDGTGQPARYHMRFAISPIGWGWGSAAWVTDGTCGGVIQGTQIGSTRTCTVLGLQPSTTYDFQMVAYRGTLGSSGVVFGDLSNVATGTTTASAGGGGQQGTIQITPNGGAINALGGTLQLSATARDANGNTISSPGISWSSSNTGVATVNSTGRVTAQGVGSAIITAMAACCTSGQVTITVSQEISTITVSPSSASVVAGNTTTLVATARDANGNAIPGVSFSWSSSSTGVATVNGSGVVSGVAQGSATISASAAGRTGTASVTVTSSTSGQQPSGYTLPNRPSNWNELNSYGFHENFPTTNGWQRVGSSAWFTHNPGGHLSRRSDASATNGYAFEARYPVGLNGGYSVGNIGLELPSPRSRFYLAFRMKHSDPFVFHGASNKLIILSTVNTSMWAHFQIAWGELVFQRAGQTPWSPNMVSSSVAASVTQRNVWKLVELLYDAPAGRIRWWVDGVLHGDHSGLTLPHDMYWLSVDSTWGGSGGTIQTTQYRWLDWIYVATP